ncbi:MAG: hypothetical protein EXS36_16345 [Pedosphaera sp.]|nr:hypothetical protein [Pedosphaera sp.]
MAQGERRVAIQPEASRMEKLAAREVRRDVYLRTGRVPSIEKADDFISPGVIAVAVKGDRRIADRSLQTNALALSPQSFLLKTLPGASPGSRTWWIIGGDPQGALFGAYRFAEHLGIRFYLHGDVVPVDLMTDLPDIYEVGSPILSTRGFLPFHDFPEGPDWWTRDDYLAYVAQLAKLRMNFIGLHTYSWKPGGEPLVWIGLPSDFDLFGQVTFSYPSSWANMQRDLIGYSPMTTRDFVGGSAQLFPTNAFGSEVMAGLMPQPTTLSDCNLLRDVFATAKGLGIKTCIGTETPLYFPSVLEEHLVKSGRSPTADSVKRELYQGIFARLNTVAPIDYYWLWTMEEWTWYGNTDEEFDLALSDIRAATDALSDVGAPIQLAISGWVLGPDHDRAAFDRLLPKDVPIASLNQVVGNSPIEIANQTITGRPKWAIPWVENDFQMTIP